MTYHHHHASGAHPSPTILPSLLRLSLPQRLAIVAVLIALLWATVFWAMR